MLRLSIALAACCSSAYGQNEFDELPAWPPQDSRPLSVRGPAQAPAAMDVPPAIVEGAVHQATFFGTLDRQEASLPPRPIENQASLYEPSPSDAAAQPTLAPVQAPSIEIPTASSLSTEVAAIGAPTESGRTLGPRSLKQPTPGGPRRDITSFGWDQLSSETVTTVGASLAVVIGLLMLLAWVWRRAAPRSSQPLPGDVVSVIGRVPLAGRQVAQLIKVGGKLVLVCVTPEGVEPITEITDPEEVARVLGLCEQHNPHSASAAFREVFADLTREPASGFLGDEAAPVDRQRLADAYANTPGGRAYA